MMNQERNTAILMADLSGYTALTEVHGARSAANIITKYLQMAQMSLRGQSQLMERVGDQLMIVSPDAHDVAITALHLLQASAAEPNFLPVHAGLHFGPVVEQEGSLYGTTVNLTARIAARAGKRQILCSLEAVQHIQPSSDFHFKLLGAVKLKNILTPVTLAELVPGALYELSSHPIDPVCHMHVENSTAFSHVHQGMLYHFCSESCLQLFRQNPDVILPENSVAKV